MIMFSSHVVCWLHPVHPSSVVASSTYMHAYYSQVHFTFCVCLVQKKISAFYSENKVKVLLKYIHTYNWFQFLEKLRLL